MHVEFEVSERFSVSPELLYKAWLNSTEHTAMTGGRATASDNVGGKFSAWDGYISGENVALHGGKRILQSWRTTEFDPDAPDSILEILFDADGNGAHVTIRHKRLPEDGMKYKQGWVDYYFEPMKEYFSM